MAQQIDRDGQRIDRPSGAALRAPDSGERSDRSRGQLAIDRVRSRRAPSGDPARADPVPKPQIEVIPARAFRAMIEADDELGQPPINIGELAADIRLRIRQIYARDGKQAAVRFAQDQVFEMDLGGLPNDQIARMLGVSVRTVESYKTALRRRNAEYARSIDPSALIGDALAHYKHIRQAAWRMVITSKSNDERRKSIELAMKAQEVSLPE